MHAARAFKEIPEGPQGGVKIKLFFLGLESKASFLSAFVSNNHLAVRRGKGAGWCWPTKDYFSTLFN